MQAFHVVKRVSTDFKIDGFAVRGLSRTAEFFCLFGMVSPAGGWNITSGKSGQMLVIGRKMLEACREKTSSTSSILSDIMLNIADKFH